MVFSFLFLQYPAQFSFINGTTISSTWFEWHLLNSIQGWANLNNNTVASAGKLNTIIIYNWFDGNNLTRECQYTHHLLSLNS